MFSHSYAFLEASHKSDVISLSVHHIRAYMMLICLIIGDMNFDQGGAGFLHSKVIIFSFVIDQFLGVGYSDTMQISCFLSDFHPQILASINGFACRIITIVFT